MDSRHSVLDVTLGPMGGHWTVDSGHSVLAVTLGPMGGQWTQCVRRHLRTDGWTVDTVC